MGWIRRAGQHLLVKANSQDYFRQKFGVSGPKTRVSGRRIGCSNVHPESPGRNPEYSGRRPDVRMSSQRVRAETRSIRVYHTTMLCLPIWPNGPCIWLSPLWARPRVRSRLLVTSLVLIPPAITMVGSGFV